MASAHAQNSATTFLPAITRDQTSSTLLDVSMLFTIESKLQVSLKQVKRDFDIFGKQSIIMKMNRYHLIFKKINYNH